MQSLAAAWASLISCWQRWEGSHGWSAEELHPAPSHVWQGCQEPPRTVGKADAHVVCASLQPVSEGFAQWQLVVEAVGGSFPRTIPPDPAILPGGTMVTCRQCKMFLCH